MVSSYLVVVSAASQVLLLVVVLTSRKAAARCGTPRVCEACRDGEALGDLHEGQEKECKIAVPEKYQQINLKDFHILSLVTHRSGRKIVPSAMRVCLSRRVCQSGGGWGPTTTTAAGSQAGSRSVSRGSTERILIITPIR